MKKVFLESFPEIKVVVVLVVSFLWRSTRAFHREVHGVPRLATLRGHDSWNFCSVSQDDYISASRSLSILDKLQLRRHLERVRSCILGITPDAAAKPHVLIPNSLCPLGKAFTDLARSSDMLRVIDIRGPVHLNLSEPEVYGILEQIRITKVLLLCRPLASEITRLTTFAAERGISIYSVFPGVNSSSLIRIPPVWGPLRGQRSSSVLENWFYQCDRNLTLTLPPKFAHKFALASAVADKLYNAISSGIVPSEFTDVEMFSVEQLHAGMNSVCLQKTGKNAFSDLVASAKPFSPSAERNLTVSFVTIVTDLERVINRFQLNLQVQDLLLSNFSDLPFEIVVCFYGSQEPRRCLDERIQESKIPSPRSELARNGLPASYARRNK